MFWYFEKDDVYDCFDKLKSIVPLMMILYNKDRMKSAES